MNDPILKIQKRYDDANVPVKAEPTASGFDLFAYKFVKLYEVSGDVVEKEDLFEYAFIRPLERVLIDTGISATVGPGYEIQIRPRSGLALKQGLTVLNTPGTIDESYRGMIGVIIVNLSSEGRHVKLGSRIAQMVVCPVILPEIQVVNSLDKTKRGEGGFGHTGN